MHISVEQIVRSKRKTMAIEIKNDGQLLVRAPMRAPLRELERFVSSNLDWIERKRLEVLEKQKLIKKRSFENGEHFLFLGHSYPLLILEHPKKSLYFDNTQFVMEKSLVKYGRELFIYWYSIQIKKILIDRVEEIASKHQLVYQNIKISKAGKRWGSCNSSGTLNFSWRLALMPIAIMDSIICHELAHLKHLNHSNEFWQQLASMDEKYKEHDKWINDNAWRLEL